MTGTHDGSKKSGRAWVIGGSACVAAVAVLALLWAGASSFGDEFIAALQATAALALLAVTWVYTQATRRLAADQKAQFDRRVDEFNAAAYQAGWELAMRALTELIGLTGKLETLSEPVADRVAHRETIEAVAELNLQVEKISDQIFLLAPSLANDLSGSAVSASNELKDRVNDVLHLCTMHYTELIRSAEARSEFDSAHLSELWETSSEPREMRWSDVAAGNLFDKVEESIRNFGAKCAAARSM